MQNQKDIEIARGVKKYKVSSEEAYNISQDIISDSLASTKPQKSPTAIILAGQSGAGKGQITAQQEKRFENTGGAIVCDIDSLRALHPKYQEIQEEFKKDSSQITMRFAVTVNNQIIDSAKKNNRNIIFDQTSASLNQVKQIHLSLVEGRVSNPYSLELHAIANDDKTSQMRIFGRYEEDQGFTGGGRFVPSAVHKRTYDGVGDVIKQAEEQKIVERIVIYNKFSEPIYDKSLENGEWQYANGELKAHEVFKNEREKPFNKEDTKLLIAGWANNNLRMIGRGAEVTEPEYVAEAKKAIDSLKKDGFAIGFPEKALPGRTYTGDIMAISDTTAIQQKSTGRAYLHQRANLAGFEQTDLYKSLKIAYNEVGKGTILSRDGKDLTQEKSLAREKDSDYDLDR